MIVRPVKIVIILVTIVLVKIEFDDFIYPLSGVYFRAYVCMANFPPETQPRRLTFQWSGRYTAQGLGSQKRNYTGESYRAY